MTERDDDIEQGFHWVQGLCNVRGCTLTPHGPERLHSWEVTPRA